MLKVSKTADDCTTYNVPKKYLEHFIKETQKYTTGVSCIKELRLECTREGYVIALLRQMRNREVFIDFYYRGANRNPDAIKYKPFKNLKYNKSSLGGSETQK